MDHDPVPRNDAQSFQGGFEFLHSDLFALFVPGKTGFDRNIGNGGETLKFFIKGLKGFMFPERTGRPDRFGDFKDRLSAVKVEIIGSGFVETPVFVGTVPQSLFSKVPEFVRKGPETDGTGHDPLNDLLIRLRFEGRHILAAEQFQSGVDVGVGKSGQLFDKLPVTDGKGTVL